jgi:rhamnosyltransferase
MSVGQECNQERPGVSVGAVIVTYNPDEGLEQNICSLLPQVNKVVIVDNHSTLAARSFIQRIASAQNIEVIWNLENKGVASALNAGIRRILASGNHRWVATFDQDSRVSPGYIDSMLQAYCACPYREKVALMGPSYTLPEKILAGKSPDYAGPLFKEMKTTMTSGNLVDSQISLACGLFDESFFIDYVDHEFCLRLRNRGFKIIEVENATLAYRLGSPSLHRLLTKTCTVTNHIPIRRYYNTRNRLRVYRKYALSESAWVIGDAYGWCKELLKLLIFETQRMEKVTNMAKGAWHAIRGQSGSMK